MYLATVDWLTKNAQLPVYPWRTPVRIRGGHLVNQGPMSCGTVGRPMPCRLFWRLWNLISALLLRGCARFPALSLLTTSRCEGGGLNKCQAFAADGGRCDHEPPRLKRGC